MKFLWLENDDENQIEKNESSRHYIHSFIRYNMGVSEKIELEPVFGLWRLPRAEAFKLTFDSDLPIITWSVYTYAMGLYDSKLQLKNMLSNAGRYGIKDKTYIDAAGTLLEALNKILGMDSNPIDLMKAVSRNFILTTGEDHSGLKRVVFEPSKVEFTLVDYKFQTGQNEKV